MSNVWDDISTGLAQAKDINRAVSDSAERFAEMLNANGNLRRVSAYELACMKRTLARFDAKRGRWKS